jgi:hexosaminidase
MSKNGPFRANSGRLTGVFKKPTFAANFAAIFPLCAVILNTLSAGVMPAPWKSVGAAGELAIDSSFTIAADSHLQSAAGRITRRIEKQTGITIIGGPKPTLIVEFEVSAPAYPTLGEDESYTLDVTPTGARLKSKTSTGALRGLETFTQLISQGQNGFKISAIHIEDRPRFPWRGLMLDVSRHWMPVEVVERNINAMAAVKLNVFHWHLSDDQGFRVESKKFPKLQQFGSDGHFYTQEQIREVIEFARDRGIRVVPEFDIPGHTTAMLTAYPEFASAPGPYAIERFWGIFQPTMNPAREETYAFLDQLLGEMAGLFPDKYFHIGGDEVDPTQWQKNDAIQAFARKNNLGNDTALQTYFTQRVQKILAAHGKTMIGWDEVLEPGLAPDTVIQSWRGQASLADAARKGYRGILSWGYYLDHLKPASFHYGVDPIIDGAEADRAGAKNVDEHVLGGEACMWDEYATAENVDSRIWPRAAAIAERLWSPRETKDVAVMYARLEDVSRILEAAGSTHRSYEPAMLDRLGRGEGLRILADASEDQEIDGRRNARKYSSLAPLNRFVDAVPPESETVRRLEHAATVAGPADIAELRARFTEWAQNDSRLEPLIEKNSLTVELVPLSRSLSALGSIGLRTLEFLFDGKRPPEGWIQQQVQAVDEIGKPIAEVQLAAVRPVRILLDRLAVNK